MKSFILLVCTSQKVLHANAVMYFFGLALDMVGDVLLGKLVLQGVLPSHAVFREAVTVMDIRLNPQLLLDIGKLLIT